MKVTLRALKGHLRGRRGAGGAGGAGVASHPLIDTYLTGLAGRLPADTVDELADGLLETWRHHLDEGRSATDAARAAIAEFGDPDQVMDAFVAQAPGRRAAQVLLATGPVVGLCWGASLIAARFWTWPVPRPAALGFGLVLLAVVVVLAVAATSRHSFRRTRLGAAGGVGLVVLDAAMLAAVVFIAPTVVWPMLAAIAASLARIGLILESLPKTLAR